MCHRFSDKLYSFRLSCCCKAFSGPFVWRNIRRVDFDVGFDNNETASDVCIKLAAKHQLCTKLDSIIFAPLRRTFIADAPAETLALKFAARLRWFERQFYTIYVTQERELFGTLNQSIIEGVNAAAFHDASLVAEFFSKPCPKLRWLSINQDDAVASRNEDGPAVSPSLRPLLMSLVANTGSLRTLVIALSTMNDSVGSQLDAVRAVISANPRFETLDFTANTDSDNNNFRCRPAIGMLKLLDRLTNAVSDPTRWETLDKLVRIHFGVPQSNFYAFGTSLWSHIVADFLVSRSCYPPLQASKLLFDAQFPECNPSDERFLQVAISKAEAFGFLLVFLSFFGAGGEQDGDDKPESSNPEKVAFLQWMGGEIRHLIKTVDLRSVSPKPFISALLAEIILTGSRKVPLDDPMAHVMRLLALEDPEEPVRAFADIFYQEDRKALDPHPRCVAALGSYLEAKNIKVNLLAPLRSVPETVGSFFHLSSAGAGLFQHATGIFDYSKLVVASGVSGYSVSTPAPVIVHLFFSTDWTGGDVGIKTVVEELEKAAAAHGHMRRWLHLPGLNNYFCASAHHDEHFARIAAVFLTAQDLLEPDRRKNILFTASIAFELIEPIFQALPQSEITFEQVRRFVLSDSFYEEHRTEQEPLSVFD